MPLYLLTCVCDEGVWDTTFKVVEAESRLDIARAISHSPWAWMTWLERSKVWRPSRDEQNCPPPDVLLKRIDASHIDGSSSWAFRIHEIPAVEHIPPPVG